MKLPDVILLSLAAALLIIGIHQVMTAGIGNAYWILMLASALFLAYTYRKRK
jgi:type IV secretory pathway TrbD component